MPTLYGIKNCDTVKKARQWLDKHKIDYRFHDFREDGLTQAMLKHFAEQLDWQELLNQRSTSWRQLDAAQKADLNEDKALQLMHETPTLIKRPLLDADGKWLVGFKAERYQAEFDH